MQKMLIGRSPSVFISVTMDIQIHYVHTYENHAGKLLTSLCIWWRELFNWVIQQGRSRENVIKWYGDLAN